MDEGAAAAVWVHQWLNRDELWPLSAALSVTDTASRAASSVISRSHRSLGLGSFLRRLGGGLRGGGGEGGEVQCCITSSSPLHHLPSPKALLPFTSTSAM